MKKTKKQGREAKTDPLAARWSGIWSGKRGSNPGEENLLDQGTTRTNERGWKKKRDTSHIHSKGIRSLENKGKEGNLKKNRRFSTKAKKKASPLKPRKVGVPGLQRRTGSRLGSAAEKRTRPLQTLKGKGKSRKKSVEQTERQLEGRWRGLKKNV